MPVVINDFQVLGSGADQPLQRSEPPSPSPSPSSKDQSSLRQDRDLAKLLRHIKARQCRIHAD